MTSQASHEGTNKMIRITLKQVEQSNNNFVKKDSFLQ